ncbi:hypothetical protein FDE77_16985 [Clostridium botulinum]|nr:hypothetical protein [Clostridium botulinum]
MKWYQKTWGIILMLILFSPIGLYLMWKSDWSKKLKYSIIGVLIIACVLVVTDKNITNDQIKNESDISNNIDMNNSIINESVSNGNENIPTQRKEVVGKSNKDIKNVSNATNVQTSVQNDLTGNWRIVKINDDLNIEEYALSYYKENFKSDKEIHGIINTKLNTTTCISNSGIFIDVRILEHIINEENNAKKLFSGKKIAEYYIYKDNGDIEKIQ